MNTLAKRTLCLNVGNTYAFYINVQKLLIASHFTMTAIQKKRTSRFFQKLFQGIYKNIFYEIRVASKSIRIQKFIVQDI